MFLPLCFDSEAPFRGALKPGPPGQDALQVDDQNQCPRAISRQGQCVQAARMNIASFIFVQVLFCLIYWSKHAWHYYRTEKMGDSKKLVPRKKNDVSA